MYIVFNLDPAVEIQGGFTFMVSELCLCKRTVGSNCSDQHRIIMVRDQWPKLFVSLFFYKCTTYKMYFLRELAGMRPRLMCIWSSKSVQLPSCTSAHYP